MAHRLEAGDGACAAVCVAQVDAGMFELRSLRHERAPPGERGHAPAGKLREMLDCRRTDDPARTRDQHMLFA